MFLAHFQKQTAGKVTKTTGQIAEIHKHSIAIFSQAQNAKEVIVSCILPCLLLLLFF